MVQLLGGLLTFLVFLSTVPDQAAAGARAPSGWSLERDVVSPSYAVAEPASTDLNIDSVALSCEQGPHRRGLQLRLYLSGAGPLAPVGAVALKDDPRVEVAIDGISHPAELLFADDFVVVADSTDGRMPFLSDTLLDALQGGRRMELHFDLVREPRGQTAFDSTAVVDLQAGRGGAAVATVRRCAGAEDQIAEKPRHEH